MISLFLKLMQKISRSSLKWVGGGMATCKSEIGYLLDKQSYVFLKFFAKFTGKNLCWSVSFNKVAGLRHATPT